MKLYGKARSERNKALLEKKAWGFGRTITAIYLALYGVLGLLNLPPIRDPLLDFLRTKYPNIAWFSDPHPMVHVLLCSAAVVSAVGVFRRRRWALWLGTVTLLIEIPFTAHVLVREIWYSQYSSTLPYQTDGLSWSANQPIPRQYLIFAILCSICFYAFFVLLLKPWWKSSPTTQSARIIRLNAALLLIAFAGFLVMAYLGFRGTSTQYRGGGRAYAIRNISEEKERLKREIEKLRRKNAKLSKEILVESLGIEFFVSSEESDALIRTFNNDLTAALPSVRTMLNGGKHSKMKGIICLGDMGSKSQANKRIAVPLLSEVLQEEDGSTQTLAAAMLAKIGERTECTPVLLKALTNRPDDQQLLFAVGGLMEAEIEIKDKAALAILEETLTHKEVTIVTFSTIILVNSHCYVEVIPSLLKMLRSTQRDHRYLAATIFWLIGPNAKSAVSALQAAKAKETDREIVDTLVLAIAAMEGG